MNNLNKLQCPSCKGYKIRSSKLVAVTLVLVGLATMVFLIGFLFILIGIMALCQPTLYTCEGCGFKFKKNMAVAAN